MTPDDHSIYKTVGQVVANWALERDDLKSFEFGWIRNQLDHLAAERDRDSKRREAGRDRVFGWPSRAR